MPVGKLWLDLVSPAISGWLAGSVRMIRQIIFYILVKEEPPLEIKFETPSTCSL